MLEHFRTFWKGLAREIAAELRAEHQGDEWIDQFRSPLRMPDQRSSRRHCEIVKRRLEHGLPGAYISPDRKQFFLTTSALSEEMLPPLAKTSPSPEAPETQDAPEEDEAYTKIVSIMRDRKSTRLNSSHGLLSRMPSSA